MKAFSIRFLVGAALLLQLVPAWPAETIKIAYIDGLSSAFALQFEEALKAFQAAVADFVVVDMFAEACTGQQTPKEAAQRAETRARRHYRA